MSGTVTRRCAILDDYRGVALRLADWITLAGEVDVIAFADHVADEDALAARLLDADIVVAMRERTPFPSSLLKRLPALRLLVTTGMRNAAIDLEAAAAQGIVVCGTPSLGHPTAELTWGLILALCRHIPHEDRATRLGGWQQSPPGRSVRGRTLGVLGLGRLGTEVARIGQAFGMTVLAWSHHLDQARCEAAGVEPAGSLDDLLHRADIVTIHLVLSARTRGLVGERELALMKPTALLVNTSRGPVVDEPALVAALRGGRLAGAALDVFDVEPIPADHPILPLENTVVTPHLGYVTEESYRCMYQGAVEDIRAWLAGSPIRVLAP
jgi:phosphoglycerate dehydrogenase-like enzyme